MVSEDDVHSGNRHDYKVHLTPAVAGEEAARQAEFRQQLKQFDCQWVVTTCLHRQYSA